jgi:hypothetical protein
LFKVQTLTREQNEKLKKIQKAANQLKSELLKNSRKSSPNNQTVPLTTTTTIATDYQRKCILKQKNDTFRPVEAKLTTELVKSNTNVEQCPICFTRWSDFAEAKVAAILPCRHVCCADCLLNFYNISSSDSSSVSEAERCMFGCPLCRFKLSKSIFDEIAHAFIKRRQLPSVNFLAKKLPFSQDYLDEMIVSLLVNTHCFDLSKVEYCLFNMIG